MFEPHPASSHVRKVITGTNPAANTEVYQTVPAGKYWGLVAVTVSLAQGLVQTPQPILRIANKAGNVVYESFGASSAQAFSTTCLYTWAPGLPLSAPVGTLTDVHATAPLPEGLVLPPYYRITTNTLGKGANSDYGAPVFFVVEFS